MSLDTGTRMRFEITTVQSKSITGFTTASYTDTFSQAVSPTISAAACNRAYFVQSTLAAGATVTFDLFSLSDPVFNETLAPVRFYGFLLYVTGTTARYMPGASNALVAPFNDSSDAWNLQSGGVLGYGSGTAETISSTVRNVRLINTNGGSTALTYKIEYLLGV